MRSIDEEVAAFVAEWESDAPYIVAHTSGSTGAPKEICLGKRIVEASARRTMDFFHLGPESRLHLCLSPSYIAGKMMIVRALLSGARLTVETPSNRPLAGFSKDGRISLLAVVPTQLEYICSLKGQLPEIENIIVGGSSMTTAQRQSAISSGLTVYETYGMTETASHIALRRVAPDEKYFSTLPGIRVTLDARGCLAIDGEDFGRIVTNDVAEVADAHRFRILGRADDVINSGGVKLFPTGIEAAVAPLVADRFGDVRFCVCGVADEKWGSVPALFVETGEEDLQDGQCLDLTRDSAVFLAEMKAVCGSLSAPRRVFALREFPMTDSGKIRRNVLRRLSGQPPLHR